MTYTWKCDKCDYSFENELSFKEYDETKNSQTCPKCNSHATRTWIMTSLAVKNCDGFFDKSEHGHEFTFR